MSDTTTDQIGVYVGEDDPEIVNFHYSNPELQQDPTPLYERMREKCPVARSERYDGFWILSKYEDLSNAYHQPTVYSSRSVSIPSYFGNERQAIPVEIDPPDHTKYRQILTPLFTPQRLKALDEPIRTHTNLLIDSFIDRGECEYISEFATALPTRIFLELMGWPIADAPMFLDWTVKLMRGVPGDEEATLRLQEEAALQLFTYFAGALDERDELGPPVTGPDADFIDYLRAASFAGERPLTQFEILDIIFIFLLAGLDTTQAILGYSTEFLATNPDYRQDLLDNPDVLDSAIEELLRWFAPVFPARVLTVDVAVRGVPMQAGDRVLLLMSAANRDPDEFENADVIDFRRHPNRHLAFGAGAHRCLGSHLARTMLHTAFAEWHRRIPDYRVKRETEVLRHACSIRGVDELHLEFAPSEG
jgi:cytochrome P450